MKILKDDIKTGNFKKYYLLYGDDSFLVNSYKNKIIKSMFPENDDINLTVFEDKGIDVSEVVSVAETLPFFAERRLIVIIKSGWFSKSTDFADYIDKAPETTTFLFVEDSIDKRNRLYKYVSSNGYCCEIKIQSKDEVVGQVAAVLKGRGLLIGRADCEYFVDKVGLSMARIQSEVDKLCAYCYGKESVDSHDIDTICFEIPENRMFQMLDFIINGDYNKAIGLYNEMVLLHEKPTGILYMMTRTFTQLYQVLELSDKGMGRSDIVSVTGLRDFVVDKYLRYRKSYSPSVVNQIVDYGLSLENKIKTGDINEQIAVEMFIVKYCKK